MRSLCLVPIVAVLGIMPASGQTVNQLSPEVRQFVSVAEPVVALTRVRVIDGTGGPFANNQTVVIANGRIQAVGRTGTVTIPSNARVMELPDHTVIPGIIGLHNHTFYYRSTPTSAVQQPYSGPRLYLAGGVTTIRTTGSLAPYADLNLKAMIDRGEIPGPRLHVTGPYIIGPGPDRRLDMLGMHEVSTEEDARRVVAYWAEEGATWIKAYTQISRKLLGVIIDEAHKNGMKVTAHLCSVGYREAVAMGIDNLEHGLFANSEYSPTKEPDKCDPDFRLSLANLDIGGRAARATISDMVEHDVAMTSTLAVIEQTVPNRPPPQQRALDMMPQHVREQELARRRAIDGPAEDNPMPAVFRKGMEFAAAFYRAGGTLVAGVDPAWGALPGFGDQRNFELLIEAGLTAEQAIRTMTGNGAKVLGELDQLGTIEAGKIADLVVIRGDPSLRPSDIRNVVTVFKGGVGYDSAKLIESVRGQLGLR